MGGEICMANAEGLLQGTKPQQKTEENNDLNLGRLEGLPRVLLVEIGSPSFSHASFSKMVHVHMVRPLAVFI